LAAWVLALKITGFGIGLGLENGWLKPIPGYTFS